MTRIKVLKPLRHRQFRQIFIGQAVSGVGDWLDYLALLVLIAYQWNMGPAALASLAVAAALPWAVVTPLTGIWADRLPGRAVMVGCDVARAAIVLAYLLAPNLPVLLGLLVLKVSFSTLFVSAERAAVKFTVPEEDLLAANSLTTLTNQATKVVGPALGGIIVASAGPRTAFALDAATFLISAMVLTRLRLPDRAKAEAGAEGGSLLSDMRAGLAFVTRSRTLLAAVGSMAATMFLVFTFDTLSPLALKALGLSPSLLGVAVAAIGLGAVAGSAAMGQWGQGLPPLDIMGVAQIAAGSLVALIGLAAVTGAGVTPIAWLPVVIGIGIGAAGILTTFSYVLQQDTPAAMVGRVVAIAGIVPTIAQLAAPPIGAAMASRFGIGSVLAASGAGLMLVGISVFLGSRTGGLGTLRPRPLYGPQPEVVAHMAVAPPVNEPSMNPAARRSSLLL